MAAAALSPSSSTASTATALSTSSPISALASNFSTSSASLPPASLPADVSANESPAHASVPDEAESGHAPVADDDDPDVAWLNINELSGSESEEFSKCLNTCVERWKAAGPEARKKMFALFAVSGIFLTVCRHGHVVIMCDMIRSGEL